MKKLTVAFYLVCILCLIWSAGGRAGAETPEFRALWITRFEWPSEDAEKCRENIRNIFENMEKANFNTAVFQVRGQCDTLYPSALEPWSPLFGSKDPGFDPLAFAIEEAHKRGIQFHAYLNPVPLYAWGRNATPPPNTTPEHPYHLHGPDSAEPWVCYDDKGKMMDPSKSEYWYLSPGIPAAMAHVRAVVKDLVMRYDIDGLHFDRIRYPGVDYSHDPVSVKRFYGRGNPNRREWFDWQREQLDKFTNDVYAEVMALKPQIIVSCAAWGIYNRHNVPGYDKFSSGFHDYYQDTWNWVRLGSMDLLMPMIYWDMNDPKPNYKELVDDFVKGIGKEHLVGGQRLFGSAEKADENKNQILYSRKANIQGTVLFAYGSAKKSGVMDRLRETIYENKADFPALIWKVKPQYGIILGTVTDETGEPLEDAWVSIEPAVKDPKIQKEAVFGQKWTTGADGRFAFLKVPPVQVKIRVAFNGSPELNQSDNFVKAGEVVKVTIPVQAKQARSDVFFHIFEPKDNSETNRAVVHLLGRALPGTQIYIQGKRVEVFSTGAFAKDNISLNMGENKINVTAVAADGSATTTRALTIIRKEGEEAGEKKKADFTFVSPQKEGAFLPGDTIEIKVQGLPGRKLTASLFKDKARISLTEASAEEGETTATYRGVYKIPANFTAAPSPVTVRIKSPRRLPKTVSKIVSDAKIEVWDNTTVRVGETNAEKTAITFGTHVVRLGGPYLTEVPKGTRMEIIGFLGDDYRIRLSESLTGWVSLKKMTMLPEGTPLPQAFFTYCNIGGDDKYDKIVIGMNENIVVAITPETQPANFLYVDLFNAYFATTWFSHNSKSKIIGPVTGEQAEDGRYRLKVPVHTKMIWGYWAEKKEGALTIYVRRAPKFAPAPESPLKGIKIALEAGHGGTGSGAVGNMGTNEKNINYNAVKAVRKLLEEKGASTVEIRPGDSNPSLDDRVQMAIAADADFLLSIHANATGTRRGFLRVSGTSTYYKEKHCEPVARMVYNELLKLEWGEFGIVGNFHYYPLRETRIPGMLVEQAFMDNPYDEARLLDADYQKQQAEAIVRGLEDFFASVRE